MTMKLILTYLCVQLSITVFSQATEKLTNQSDIHHDSITFITIMNIANATKDGIYLNDYVVNIDYEKATKLNGKKIKISGEVTIIKGLKNLHKEFDKEGHEIISQGRENDNKYIESPIIEIIENKK
jgi:hypothetical protein